MSDADELARAEEAWERLCRVPLGKVVKWEMQMWNEGRRTEAKKLSEFRRLRMNGRLTLERYAQLARKEDT